DFNIDDVEKFCVLDGTKPQCETALIACINVGSLLTKGSIGDIILDNEQGLGRVIRFISQMPDEKAGKAIGWSLIQELDNGIWKETNAADSKALHKELNRQNILNWVGREGGAMLLTARHYAEGSKAKFQTVTSVKLSEDSYRHRLMYASV